ncbi:MAG: hypothetical protein HY361_04470, partial [Candidatus Aenigmarchaeota archaeon]|nr:hypothetical protein [Candidatus Aenigmarchaeota archaeon]
MLAAVGSLEILLSGNKIDYLVEVNDKTSSLHPNMLIELLQFDDLSGDITLFELGRTKQGEHEFITTFVIDTTNASFTAGNFTKRVEGKDLYFCSEWENTCLSNWTLVQDLQGEEYAGEEYTSAIQPGVMAYGETISPNYLKISSGLSSGLDVQGAISAAQADGLIAYGELNIAIPRFRTWNSSNNFSAEQNALSIGTGGTDDITWVVTKANHEQDEVIVGTEDKSNDVNIQIYTPANNSWGNLLEVSTDVRNSAYRAFDIAVEDISGEVLIVYENSSTADTTIQYVIWNGTGYSSQQNITTGMASSAVNWAALFPRTGTDEIMLLIHDSEADNSGDIYAIPWDGTEFNQSKGLLLSEGTKSSTDSNFAFAWDEASGNGLVVYGEGNNLVYRTYNVTGTTWSGETTIALGNGLNAVRLCSEPTSDYIGLIWQDTGNDVNVRMWDGTTILASPPTEDGATESHGTNNPNVDCAWVNGTTALFGFIEDNSLSVDYFNFTKPNSWSISALTTVPKTVAFASDDIEGMRFVKHPTTNEVMITAMDILEDISLIRWDGETFRTIGESPIEQNTEVLNGAQEGAMFDWYRYDPVPNVTNVSPSGLTYSSGVVIDINATVVDNILVGVVLANITYPNGSIQQLTLANRTGNNTLYNISFTTSDSGTYTVRIIANDTSAHKNVNQTETSTFLVISGTAPLVNITAPSNNSNYTLRSGNQTFNASVYTLSPSTVLFLFNNASGTDFNISAVNYSGYWIASYNVSTLAEGSNTVTVFANDTSALINNTQQIVIITDYTAPRVAITAPTNNRNYSISSSNQTFSATISEENYVPSVLFMFDNASGANFNATAINNSGTWSTSYNVSTLADGVNTMTVIANDSAGNYNQTISVSFIVDYTAPRVTITAPANNSNYSISSSNQTFSATISEENYVPSVLFSFDNASGANFNATAINNSGTWSASYNVSTLAEGVNTMTVIANDSVGHYNQTQYVSFIVDYTAPLVTITAPTNNSNYSISSSNQTFSAVISDLTIQSVLFSFDNASGANFNATASNNSGTWSTSYNVSTLAEGTNTMTVIANDSVGHY